MRQHGFRARRARCFEQVGAFTQDALGNPAPLETQQKLKMVVLAVRAGNSFGTGMAAELNFAADPVTGEVVPASGHWIMEENPQATIKLVVRSRSIIGNIGASPQTLIGGNITQYTQLCERARDALALMVEHALKNGANAVIGMRCDADKMAAGVTEVLDYATAVVVERV